MDHTGSPRKGGASAWWGVLCGPPHQWPKCFAPGFQDFGAFIRVSPSPPQQHFWCSRSPENKIHGDPHHKSEHQQGGACVALLGFGSSGVLVMADVVRAHARHVTVVRARAVPPRPHARAPRVSPTPPGTAPLPGAHGQPRAPKALASSDQADGGATLVPRVPAARPVAPWVGPLTDSTATPAHGGRLLSWLPCIADKKKSLFIVRGQAPFRADATARVGVGAALRAPPTWDARINGVDATALGSAAARRGAVV